MTHITRVLCLLLPLALSACGADPLEQAANVAQDTPPSSTLAPSHDPAVPEGLPPGHPPLDAPAPGAEAPTVTEDIEPPTGGTTVAAVWANRASLDGTKVTLRGKVVKFNGGILGRNWAHLQDGTGQADDGTNDLTVTTDGFVKVGDVVTVTGTVVVDRDFGAGYSYPVLLEGATVVGQ